VTEAEWKHSQEQQQQDILRSTMSGGIYRSQRTSTVDNVFMKVDHMFDGLTSLLELEQFDVLHIQNLCLEPAQPLRVFLQSSPNNHSLLIQPKSIWSIRFNQTSDYRCSLEILHRTYVEANSNDNNNNLVNGHSSKTNGQSKDVIIRVLKGNCH
jgi:hypothetical protein